MTTPQRPWWKRKRWVAVGCVALLVWYPISSGPVAYCVARGWLSESLFFTVSRPIGYVIDAAWLSPWDVDFDELPWWRRGISDIAESYVSYVQWCIETGGEHEIAEVRKRKRD